MNESSTDTLPTQNRFAGLRVGALNREEKETITKLALAVLAARVRSGRVLGSPVEVREFLCLKLADRRNEVFGVLFLDNQHRVIQLAELFEGTIDGASVYPRVVVQRALEVNAAAVVFFHNHPSGVAEPSQADQRLTQRLKAALGTVDIRVLDHFVVGDADATSFCERGLL